MLATVEMTRDQKRKWADTMSLMTWTAPGFTHLWYKLLQNHDGEYAAVMTKDCPGGVACTDSKNIYVNPDNFFEYGLKERVFIGAHEVLHDVCNDVDTIRRLRGSTHITCSDGKVFPYDEEIMQKAMDYCRNALLVESRIGVMPKDALYDPKIAEAKDGIMDIYGKVYKQDQNGGPSGKGILPGQGNANGQNGFDPCGVQPPKQGAPRNPQQWALEIAQAARLEQGARSQGKMPGALQRLFNDILNPKVPWTDYILAISKRVMGSGSYNWRKPDRRFIGRDLWLPGRGGSGAGWLAIWGDTSGSISATKLNKYLGGLKGMIEETKPRRLSVVWCDDSISRVDEITDLADLDSIRAKSVGGGGGTSVKPVFDWIHDQREEPDMFIGMTDGHVSFPDKPNYPIVWASVGKGQEGFPYGTVVEINECE